MDSKDKQKLSIHRCRFVDFTPSAISALAFPPLPLPRLRKGRVVFDSGAETASGSSSKGRKFGTLAVGRANGNIELYEWSRMEHHIKSAQSWALWKVRIYTSRILIVYALHKELSFVPLVRFYTDQTRPK